MKYKYRPKNKIELVNAIRKEIYEVQGTKNNPNWEADLNCIDTSLITDMSYLFSYLSKLDNFNGNISEWNVSNVKDMSWTFANSKFNKDISKWNVSNVTNMTFMFGDSIFNQDISNWNINKVKNMNFMFWKSKFNQPLNNWNIGNVENIRYLFASSEFNQNISNWNINDNINIENMFIDSEFNKDIGNWPKKIKEQTGLENISVSSKYPKLPDEIKYPETIANIFDYVIENPNSKKITKNQAINILKEWMNNKQKRYIRKNLDKKTAKQLLTNYFLDIYKNINNKNKFLELLKNNKINVEFYKDNINEI